MPRVTSWLVTKAILFDLEEYGGGGLIFLQNWRRWPHFPTKLAAAASFSFKIGSGGKDLTTLLEAVLTWSGYWR